MCKFLYFYRLGQMAVVFFGFLKGIFQQFCQGKTSLDDA